jgi:hypothetical protein
MKVIYIVHEETGAHDPNGVFSAWSTLTDAKKEAARLNVGQDYERFCVQEMPFNTPTNMAWNWDAETIKAMLISPSLRR